MTNETWGCIQDELRRAVGEANYANWIRPLKLVRCDGGTATFEAPTGFFGNWVRSNFGDVILTEMAKAGTPIARVEFVAAAPAKRPAAEIAPRPAPAVAREAAQKDDLPAPSLDQRFTFDSFVVGKPNELAHAAARRVAESETVTFNPLFLYGGVGLGKTHLMHAVAWELLRRRPDARVIYMSAEQFMYQFVQALRDKDMIAFKTMFRSVDVLMVDDVQFIAGKDATQEEFFHTFNALVDAGKQIIVSSDRAPSDISGIEDRLGSRLLSGLVVDLHPTNYELRLGILQQKVEQYATQFTDFTVQAGVLEFMAHRISTNVRVLEGALMRLFAFGALIGKEITMEMAQECLQDVLRSSEKKITVEEILRKVSDHYNIRLSDLIGPKRLRTYARPRQMAMYLAKQMTQRSLPEIGRRIGGRDHTTVMHGVRKIEELRLKDSQIAEDLELLRRALEA